MTTGNIDTGFTSIDSAGCNWGSRFQKVWAGGDWTAAEKQQGVRPPHPYGITILQDLYYPLVDYRIKPSGSWTLQRSTNCKFGYPSFPRHPELYNQAINKLFGLIKGSDFNAAIFAAELKPSLDMIGQSARKIARSWNRLRRGDFRGAAVALTGSAKGVRNKTAGNWLELQYGWLPLLKDTYGAVEFIKSKLERIEPFTFKIQMKSMDKGFGNTSICTYGYTYHESRMQILAYLEEKVSLVVQLGLADPASVVWERTPYSFVIDWFLPIGPYLEALSAARSLTGKFYSTEFELDVAKNLQSGTLYEINGGKEYKHIRVAMNRTIRTGLSPKIPPFKPLEKVASLGHTLNGLALLSNLKR